MGTMNRVDLAIACGLGILGAAVLLVTQAPLWVYYIAGAPLVVISLVIDHLRHPRPPATRPSRVS